MKKFIALFLCIGLSMLLFACSNKVSNKQTTVSFQDQEYIGLYTGEFIKGKPSGNGNFIYQQDNDFFKYEGEFEDGVPIGTGILDVSLWKIMFQEKEIAGQYKGDAVNGKPDGKGVFTYKKDDDWFTYDGEFKDGQIEGAGTLDTSILKVAFKEVTRTGKYKGDTIDSVPGGKGEFTAVNDSGKEYTYSGEWKNGLCNGQGSRTWKDKDYGTDEVGTFKDGGFAPTFRESLIYCSKDNDTPFTISNKANSFLLEHEDLFPVSNLKNINTYLDKTIERKKMMKNPENFGDKIMILNGTVTQIFEVDWFSGQTLTMINVSDDDYNIYTVYYIGKCSYYQNDKIIVYGLPVSSSSFSNISGGTTLTYVLAGSYIK